MLTTICVNQHAMIAGEPSLLIETTDSAVVAREALIYDERGAPVARIVHRPDAPLGSGARVWVETCNHVEAIA